MNALQEKLLAAFRKGRKKRPYNRITYMYSEDGGACALGAIVIGLGADEDIVSAYLGLPSVKGHRGYISDPYDFAKKNLKSLGYEEIHEALITTLNDIAVKSHSDPDEAVTKLIKENDYFINPRPEDFSNILDIGEEVKGYL